MSKFNDKAVALKYRKERDKAPVIVAAGKGQIAKKIVKIADQEGVPVYKDTNAATILSQLAVGSYIPSELYAVIANIYVCIIEMAESLKGDGYKTLDLEEPEENQSEIEPSTEEEPEEAEAEEAAEEEQKQQTSQDE